MRLRGPFPLVIGHRGDPVHAPENTLHAFEAARAQGADLIELDILPTADAHLVVMHDATLDRTTDGSGPVCARTLAEIGELDAGSWFGKAFRGVRVPTLREVLQEVPPDVLLNVEIKPEQDWSGYAGPHPAILLAELLDATGRADSCVVSSFSLQVLREVRRTHEAVRLAVLADGSDASIDIPGLCLALDAAAYNPCWRDVTPALVSGVQRAGLAVLPWASDPENNPRTMKHVLDLGCDGFFANDPGSLAGLVGPYRRARLAHPH